MPFVRNLPIQRKLLVVTMATCGTALALACTALFWFQSINFRKGLVAELESLASVVAHNSAASLASKDKKSAVEVLSALTVKPHITSVSIYDAAGTLFASKETGHLAHVHEAAESKEPFGIHFDHGFADLTLPVEREGRVIGRLNVCARFQDRYRELLSLYAFVLAAVLFGSLIVIFFISSALQRLITGPIDALATAARRVSEQEDYSTRAREAGRDEVGLLTRTFNQMLDHIQSRELRLRESQQRFEVAVQGSSDGIWDRDLVANTVYFSPRWKSMLGYTDEELPNRIDAFHGLIHPDDLRHVLAREAACLAGIEPTYEVEFRARHKDRGYRWILTRGAALRSDEGKAVRFAGSHTDITERKQAEEEIRLARSKFESLVNSIHGIVWEADAATVRMTFVSNQVERILGYPVNRWLDEPGFWEQSIHPEDRARAVEARKLGLAAGKPFELEFRSVAADGRTVWLHESVSVEHDGGQPARLRGLGIDITEKKLADEQIGRMQRELVAASRQAGMAEVATGVLHNVGNVLNSINVSATLIADQLRKSRSTSLSRAVELLQAHREDIGGFLSNDPKGRQLPAFLEALSGQLSREQVMLSTETQALLQNIEHIKQIVSMQQSYAKPSGAREVLALDELVEDALRMSAASMAGRRIEVVREFVPAPPVLVDRHVVIQILINLLKNAQQAMDSRDSHRRLTLRIAHDPDQRVRVEVSDNGSGIARENLTRIFQHGFTTKRDGHGFGLHSGANAAKEMGGRLFARSEGPGLGATFILELPASQSTPLQQAA